MGNDLVRTGNHRRHRHRFGHWLLRLSADEIRQRLSDDPAHLHLLGLGHRCGCGLFSCVHPLSLRHGGSDCKLQKFGQRIEHQSISGQDMETDRRSAQHDCFRDDRPAIGRHAIFVWPLADRPLFHLNPIGRKVGERFPDRRFFVAESGF